MSSETLDLGAIRTQHTLLLLRKLWVEDISRAELSRRIGLSRSAISSIVGELIEAGLVLELGQGASQGGRKPTILHLKGDAAFMITIDLGAKHVKIALSNLRCQLHDSTEFPHDVALGATVTYSRIFTAIQHLLSLHPEKVGKLAAISISVPGPVDQSTGELIVPPNMPGWHGENLSKVFSKQYGLTTFVDNDANLGALAEGYLNPHNNASSLIYIKAATGIGAGILIDGQIYRGFKGGSGELGHISINENGPLSSSGNPGSLESYASGPVMLKQLKQQLPYHPHSGLTAQASLQELCLAAAHGDELAVELMRQAGSHLGVAMTTLLNLFNPAQVILGGAMSLAGEVLLDAITQMVQSRALAINRNYADIRCTSFGLDTSLYGAAVNAMLNLFSPEGIYALYKVSRV